jgi:hypothetical protein
MWFVVDVGWFCPECHYQDPREDTSAANLAAAIGEKRFNETHDWEEV